jgi:N6-adenosine-specific RNA methylase IME4
VQKAVAVRPDAVLVSSPDVVIPDTVADLTASMNALGSGVMLAGWATAATVYAWTEAKPGKRSDLAGNAARLTFVEFAALQLRGLRDRETVAAYRAAWAVAIGNGWAKDVKRGDVVALPAKDFDLGRVRDPQPPAETPPLPDGTYSTIVADPPWDILTGPDWGSGGRARPLLYSTMPVADIARLGVGGLAAPDAHLYIWTINAYLAETYGIARAWGFEPSTLLTWCKKPHGIGLGGTYILTTEHILFCRRGSLAALDRVDTSWFDWPRGAHSVKPDGFYEMVERVSPGPRLEMFARAGRPGWSAWGNEAPE